MGGGTFPPFLGGENEIFFVGGGGGGGGGWPWYSDYSDVGTPGEAVMLPPEPGDVYPLPLTPEARLAYCTRYYGPFCAQRPDADWCSTHAGICNPGA